MAVYEKDDHVLLGLALESILQAQVSLPEECVIVCDGPLTKELECVIRNAVSHSQFVSCLVLTLAKNSGLAYALNYGLGRCANSLVARMDADDIAHPSRLNRQFEFMTENTNISICGSWVYEVDIKGAIIGSRRYPVGPDKVKKLLWTNPLAHPSVMYQKDKILGVGGYNSNNNTRSEDLELWLKASRSGLILDNIPEELVYYRIPSTYRNKRSIAVSVGQVRVQYEALRYCKASAYNYVYLLYPLLVSITPSYLLKFLIILVKQFDIRFKN
jgi:amylovoran biosynthesis glycosyltransferase AmsE